VKSNLSVCLFWIIAVFTYCVAEYAPNVRIDNELYQLMLRFHAVHSIALPDDIASQPLNYKGLERFFRDADSLVNSGMLTLHEQHLLYLYQKKYSFERNRIRWASRSGDIHIKADLDLNADIIIKDDNAGTYLKGTIGPSLKGTIGKLSFYSGIDVWTEYFADSVFTRSIYEPYNGVSYNVYGRETDTTNIRSADLPHGGIRYEAGRIALETAIDKIKFGPSVDYPLTLNGLTPPITFARAILDMEIAHYSHIAGLLKSQKDRKKYIYAHRLEFSLFDNVLQAGINEVIITGDATNQNLGVRNKINPEDTGVVRGWEWAYLIPFVPFKFVEHYAGDRDNAAVSLDFSLWYPDKCRWYLEFLLDDMLNPLELFSDDWGNKWALTAGGQYFTGVFSRDLNLSIEYSHVEPWVYTHFYGGSHSYTHYGQSLGNPLGPNSQAVSVSAEYALSRANTIKIRYLNRAKNSSVRGGIITDVFQDRSEVDSTQFHDSKKKKFLGDGTRYTSVPSVEWIFYPARLFSVSVRYAPEFTREDVAQKLYISGGFMF
jgi:hypothetical protein